MATERIILGIDPGTVVMGFGIIRVEGKKCTVLHAGVLKLNGQDEHYDRLKQIFEKLLELIETYHPDELAIEEPFFGKNVQSMLKLGRAQGVAIAAALYRQIPVFGYSPRSIKQSITGKGGASKEQVAAMISTLLGYENESKFLDASDALGVALCHYFQSRKGTEHTVNADQVKAKSKAKKYTGWSAFLQENPGRTKKSGLKEKP